MPPAPIPSTPALGGSRWNTFPAAGTTLTAREFFTATEPLLQGIIDDNALTSADSAVLEGQIRAALALGTRETSLPLSLGPDSASAARELDAQAETIGQELASWSTKALWRGCSPLRYRSPPARWSSAATATATCLSLPQPICSADVTVDRS
ncbi:hypothetical protein GCM10010358_77430 [Streptomyces minutiscleroticus]|uniref:Uncharacterized protein n=1 Tax=Streptomyces minutiscleroticus TaxID=68238 RepID=A0A918U9V1_9ACTN|nr:hypothetical protein [Streptomyces minutiscleroticus]GGY13721.1 hypothetical protein GCM10010358_77430 [Streptomyces minutiscleroticus]